MKFASDANGTGAFTAARMLAAFTLALVLLAPVSRAMAQAQDAKPIPPQPEPYAYQTFYLNNITEPRELNDIATDLRNMLSHAKIFSVASQNIISVEGSPAEVQLAQKIVADLDRARKIYRLTYTITDVDGGKDAGARTFSLVAASGERTLFKQGSRVPIVTGSYDTANAGPETQVQYQDIGMNIEATVVASVDGLMLRTKVEQSSLSEEKSVTSPQDPVFHQSVIEGVTALAPGKPVVLGSLDVPGTTRKQQIEVAAERVE